MSYPHCWRCDTPLIYYARESWFIKMTAVKDDLIRNNNTVNWIPESIGKGRFGDWLENVQDWGISRNRYWGTPLNIWECELRTSCSPSAACAELQRKVGDELPGRYRAAPSVYRCGDHHVPGLRQGRCTVCRKLSTAGLIPVQCRLHSIIIRLKIRICLSSSSLPNSFPRLWTRPVAGSIP